MHSTIDGFRKHVSKILLEHLRFAAGVEGRRPSTSAATYLVDYVVRTAQRECWNTSDVEHCSHRIKHMMFAEHSELIELAHLSGFTFVDEETLVVEETVLSSSTERFTSDVVSQQPDLQFHTGDLPPSDSETITSQYSIIVM